MRRLAVTLAFLGCTILTFAQKDLITFKTEAASAFIWGEESQPGVVSSSVRDPVTGNAIHKLEHAGIEVSSRAGFERVGSGRPGEFLSFTTTIVNNTESEVGVRQGNASVDGHLAVPLPVVANKKGLSKKKHEQARELAEMSCFAGGFLANDLFVSPNSSSKGFVIAPKKALTISFVTKDPRYYSILCSVDGCYPKGTIRFSVAVNSTDFVFVWQGRSLVNCGE
jgi:hypothetical protein